MEFINVFNSLNPAEADLVRAQLEAAGFDARVKNEFSSVTFIPPAGGVFVQVPEDRADDARALIAETILKDNSSSSPSE